MRFKPYPRQEFSDTQRKRKAVLRKQKREREALPLFADQIAKSQPSVDNVMHRRNVAWANHQARDRSKRAKEWWQCRARLAQYPTRIACKLRIAWRCAPYPADPWRLRSFLQSYDIGRIELDALPFPLSRTDGSGTRTDDLFSKPVPHMFIDSVTAKEVASRPSDYSIEYRRSAYHHLQTHSARITNNEAAKNNKVLAASLFLRLGELDEEFYG